jgi:hypothetical protein
MRKLIQSTSRVVMLKVFLSSDHITPATGKTVAITISKNGGAFGNPNAGATNATEVSSGWYKVTLDTTDTATIGDLVVRGTSATCDDTEQVCEVVGDAYTLLTAAHSEPAQGTPAANASLASKIGYLFKAWRNRVAQTATTYSLYNDDATTVDHKSTVSDNGTTFAKGEMVTGP